MANSCQFHRIDESEIKKRETSVKIILTSLLITLNGIGICYNRVCQTSLILFVNELLLFSQTELLKDQVKDIFGSGYADDAVEFSQALLKINGQKITTG